MLCILMLNIDMAPFHMRVAIPLSRSRRMILPKLSVVAASLLSGHRTMTSPCLLLSGTQYL